MFKKARPDHVVSDATAFFLPENSYSVRTGDPLWISKFLFIEIHGFFLLMKTALTKSRSLELGDMPRFWYTPPSALSTVFELGLHSLLSWVAEAAELLLL